MKTDIKFMFIGAGSVSFTLKLISDILHEEDFIKSGELRLVDVVPEALDNVYEAVCTMIKTAGRDFKVTKHLDFKQASPGVDFVFFTFVTGGYKSWKTDIDICEKYGVIQTVGDTIGPGGLIRAVRNIPVVLEVCKELEKVAPEAWAINYSNPEGALCLAIEAHTKIRTFGLCHGTPDTVKMLAHRAFNVEPERLKFSAAGINHLTWITELKLDGQDAYPLLKEKLIGCGLDEEEPISYELLNIYGKYPAPGDWHVNEFFPHYLRESVKQAKSIKLHGFDAAAMIEGRNVSDETLESLKRGEIGFKEFGTSGETATNFIRALITGVPALEMCNVQNNGYIDNLSSDIAVEIPAYIDEFGLHPVKIGRLPDGIAAKCETLGREYKLIVDGAVEYDKNKLLAAMMIDPLCCNCDFPEKLLDELLTAYLPLLPKGWNNYFN